MILFWLFIIVLEKDLNSMQKISYCDIMNIIIGSDHGGFELKQKLVEYLEKLGYNVADMGADSLESVDYPDYAEKVADKVKKDSSSLGILVCGTGLGMSMAENKIKGIRAALCYNESSGRLAREHNDANILCLGGREFDEKKAKSIVKSFLESSFSGEERHKRRIQKIAALEK